MLLKLLSLRLLILLAILTMLCTPERMGKFSPPRAFEENDIVWIKPYDRKGFIHMKLSSGFSVKYLDRDGHEQLVYCVPKLLEHVPDYNSPGEYVEPLE